MEQNKPLIYPVIPSRGGPDRFSRRGLAAIYQQTTLDARGRRGQRTRPDSIHYGGEETLPRYRAARRALQNRDVCKTLQNVRLPDGSLKVVVEGGYRAQAVRFATNESFMLASVTPLETEKCEPSA